MDLAAFFAGFFAEGEVLTIPVGIDYFSVLAGVLTGALFACDRKLDIIGCVVLGLVTGFGGGIIRDLLMQDHGVYFTSHPDLIVLSMLIAVFVFYFRGVFKNLDAKVFFADALSVGLFALAGSSKAFACGEGFVVSVILGALTAVGGGAVREICVGETPAIFQQSNFYAVAGIGGSLAYVSLAHMGCPVAIAGVICVGVVVLLRYVSVWFNWKTKGEADLTERVSEGVEHAKSGITSMRTLLDLGGAASAASKAERQPGIFHPRSSAGKEASVSNGTNANDVLNCDDANTPAPDHEDCSS